MLHRVIPGLCLESLCLHMAGQDLLSYPEGIRARTTHSHMAA